jgi:hypothetical protein
MQVFCYELWLIERLRPLLSSAWVELTSSEFVRASLTRAIASAATSLPTGPIVLARWRRDRGAGNGILIEGLHLAK